MIRSRKAQEGGGSWFLIALLLALFMVGIGMYIGVKYGFSQPKKVLGGIYTDIEKKTDVTGGMLSDQDEDGVPDDRDLCCHCDQKSPKVAGADVATAGPNMGCAAGQIQTGAGTCIGPCSSNVA